MSAGYKTTRELSNTGDNHNIGGTWAAPAITPNATKSPDTETKTGATTGGNRFKAGANTTASGAFSPPMLLPSTPSEGSTFIAAPAAAPYMTEVEVATAVEAAERQMPSTPNTHWRNVAANHEGVETDPWVYDGRPVIRGTRIPVSVILGYMTLGGGREALLRDYPDLNDEAIQSAVDFTLGLLGE